MFRKIFLENKIATLLFVTFVIIYIIAINRGLELLYVISELSLATLILSFIAPYFNLIGVHVALKHPKYSTQTQKIPISITIKTYSFFPKFFLEIYMDTPFSKQQKHMFFLKFLEKDLTIQADISSHIRGVHKIQPIYIETAFPLGIKTYRKKFEDTKSEIIILPIYYRIKHFPLHAPNHLLSYGKNTGKQKGGYDEFVSIRDYKKGDSPRHIHWPSSARKRKLIVKEYQNILSTDLTIILDLNKNFNVGSFGESTLEYAITIASSLSIYGLTNGYSVNIFGHGANKINLLNLKGSHNRIKILKKLAHADSNGNRKYTDVIKHFLNLQKNNTTLILFDNGNGEVEQNIASYNLKNSKIILFSIDAKSFSKDDINENFQLYTHAKYLKYALQKGCDIQRMLS